MGFRFRKTFSIAPGVRISVTPRSLGVSGGMSGARVSASSSQRITSTVGVPGSGLSYSKSVSGKSPQRTPSPTRGRAAPSAAPAPKPPWFAPTWEKVAFAAATGTPDPAKLQKAAKDPRAADLLALLEAILISLPNGDTPRLIELLEPLHAKSFEPKSNAWFRQYISSSTLTVRVAQEVTATMPIARDSIGLLLAEAEQREGNIEAAILVVEAIEPTTIAAVSLAELYGDLSRWADIIDLTNGISNVDEPSTYLLIQRGRAMRELGYFEASRESLKEALRLRSRPVELRSLALAERGKTYLAEGKKGMARRDFEMVLSGNSSFDSIRDLLALTD